MPARVSVVSEPESFGKNSMSVVSMGVSSWWGHWWEAEGAFNSAVAMPVSSWRMLICKVINNDVDATLIDLTLRCRPDLALRSFPSFTWSSSSTDHINIRPVFRYNKHTFDRRYCHTPSIITRGQHLLAVIGRPGRISLSWPMPATLADISAPGARRYPQSWSTRSKSFY